MPTNILARIQLFAATLRVGAPGLLVGLLLLSSALTEGCSRSIACHCTAGAGNVSVDLACGDTSCIGGLIVECSATGSIDVTS